MKRTIDRVVKQAKRTGRRIAKRNQSKSGTMKGITEQLEQKADTLMVWGPYQEGPTSFRLKISESGIERSLKFRTQEEAEGVKEELQRKHSQTNRVTVAVALSEWLAELTLNVKPNTIANYRKMALQLPQKLVMGQLTEEQASKLYQEQIHRPSVYTGRQISTATQHLFLWVARHFWIWAMEKGYARQNPWMKVRKVGRANVGKPQLRIDEARKLEAVAIQRAQEGNSAALGVLLMLYLGLRQGEVTARVARDIDDDGRVLWIPSGKTKNARRRLKIPEQIRPLVLARTVNQEPGALLFYPQHHSYQHRNYYVVQLARLCRLAGVPVICPHSLRGMHATLALEGGATGDAVAKALGHGSFEMTKTHYASASSVANNESGRVAAALAGVPKEKELLVLLKNIPSDELDRLLLSLRSGCQSGGHIEENGAT